MASFWANRTALSSWCTVIGGSSGVQRCDTVKSYEALTLNPGMAVIHLCALCTLGFCSAPHSSVHR